MSTGSSFGKLFRITTFGESHGGAVGVVVEGVPPNLPLDVADIQTELDRRKPGQSAVGTSRKEPDTVSIMSGIFEEKTTGTPMLLILFNSDHKSSDYNDIKDKFRPGHADFTYLKKYNIRDWRGSGRASGRETAGRVAAGAIAKKILANHGVNVIAYTVEAAGIACQTVDLSVIEQNPLRCCDLVAAKRMEQRILELSDVNDSAGGIVECVISGLAAGIGEPVFDKLDAELSKAILSIGAIKGIEFGAGFASAKMTGSQHNDAMSTDGYITNHAGGIIGGISNGEDIVFRAAVKPTSSISKEQQTVDIDNNDTTIQTHGRHDVCICPRIVPVIEAMAAITVLDHIKRQHALVV